VKPPTNANEHSESSSVKLPTNADGHSEPSSDESQTSADKCAGLRMLTRPSSGQ
jgi:hypothetical protein